MQTKKYPFREFAFWLLNPYWCCTMVGHIDGLLCAEINTNTAGGEYDLVSEKEKPLCSRQRFIVIFCFQNSQANNADAATIKALPASDNSISAAKGAPQSPKPLPVHSCHPAAQGKQQSRQARQAVIVNLTSALCKSSMRGEFAEGAFFCFCARLYNFVPCVQSPNYRTGHDL